MALNVGHVLRPASERFTEKTRAAPNGCIEWTGGQAGAGYGSFYVGRTGRDQSGRTFAHRWAYEQSVGPIPAGMHVDHLCRNRLCVNPEHLEAVTPLENVRRSHGNNSKTHCPADHPYSGDNLYVAPSGQRQCRTCKRAANERYRDKNIKTKES